MDPRNFDEGTLAIIIAMYRQAGQTLLNTFHYFCTELTDPMAGTDIRTVAQEFSDQWWKNTGTAHLKTVLSSELNFTGTYIKQLNTPNALPFKVADNASAGSVDGVTLPTGCCAVIQRRCDGTGRHRFGRVYIPGILAELTENSVLTDEAKTALEGARDFMNDNLVITAEGSQSTWRPVLVRHIPDTTIYATNGFIFDAAINDVVCYQRRREVGVGI